MVRTLARVTGVTAAAAVWAMCGGADVSALSCVERPDNQAAAEEAIRGEHPLWAMGYMVAIVEGISDADDGGLLSVAVRPTHVFVGTYAERLTVRARPDGPPDPHMFEPGRSYFLSLGHADPATGELLIQPCAPNFEASQEQVERLVLIAPSVEIREPGAPAPGGVPAAWPLIIGVAVVATIGVGTATIARRR